MRLRDSRTGASAQGEQDGHAEADADAPRAWLALATVLVAGVIVALTSLPVALPVVLVAVAVVLAVLARRTVGAARVARTGVLMLAGSVVGGYAVVVAGFVLMTGLLGSSEG